jgi:light-independent protochlorophyllide reductase subunit B
VLHAPQGDTYADLLFTMIERRAAPAGHLHHLPGARPRRRHGRAVQDAAREAYERFQPQAMLVGASCTAELIQDDPGGLAKALACRSRSSRSSCRPTSARKTGARPRPSTSWCARWPARTAAPRRRTRAPPARPGRAPAATSSGPTALGFRHRDDVVEITACWRAGHRRQRRGAAGRHAGRHRAPAEADFNVVLYPEIAGAAAQWLERNFGQPRDDGADRRRRHARLHRRGGRAGRRRRRSRPCAGPGRPTSRLPWYSRSVDSTYLTGKRVFVFGDATHAVAAARVAPRRWASPSSASAPTAASSPRVREAAKLYGVEPLITDDYLEVEARSPSCSPSWCSARRWSATSPSAWACPAR